MKKSLPGPLWPGMVPSDRALSVAQMEQKLRIYGKLNFLK